MSQRILLLLLTLFIKSCALAVSPTWLINPDFQARSFRLIQNITGYDLTQTGTLSFTKTFDVLPNIAYGITQYQGDDVLEQEKFQIYLSDLSLSSFSLQFQITGTTSLWLLQVRYIAIDRNFPNKLNAFDNVPINYGSLSPLNISSGSTPITFTNVINFTSQSISKGFAFLNFQQSLNRNKIVLFMTSLHEKGLMDRYTAPNPIEIRSETKILSNESYQISVRVGVNLSITRLHYSMIIFDEIDVSSSNQYKLVYQVIEVSAQGGFVQVPQQLINNLIVGLLEFSIHKTNTIMHFNFVFTTNQVGNYGISLPLLVPRYDSVLAKSYTFTLFYIKTWRCPPFSLYNTSSDLCQKCPYLVCSNEPVKCGDGIQVILQQCDDGNLRNGDGCSSNCKIQNDFKCKLSSNLNQKKSICHFTGHITLNVLYIDKIDFENKIEIVLDMQPKYDFFWDDVNFAQMVSLSNMTGLDSYQVIRNTDGTISLMINYSVDIQGHPTTIQLDPRKSGKSQITNISPILKSFEMVPTDNQGAVFYNQNIYDIANFTTIFSYMLAAFALFLFVVSIFGGKLVGIEMIAVLQISYFSLFTIQQLNPCFKALTKIWFINGFNYYDLSKKYLNDINTPIKMKGIFMYSRFFQNYNTDFLVVILPLIVAACLLVLSVTIFKENKQKIKKLRKICKNLLGQYVMFVLMFSGYIISVSFGIEVMYGIKNMADSIGPLSLALGIFVILIYVIIFVLKIVKSHYFGEFTSQFQKASGNTAQSFVQFSQNKSNIAIKIQFFIIKYWYNILMLERFSIGLWLVFTINMRLSLIFPIIVFAILLILALKINPYNQKLHNFRFICNMVVAIIIQLIYLWYNISKSLNSNQRQSQFWVYMPLVICTLLTICIIFNSIFSLRQLVNKLKKEEEGVNKHKSDGIQTQLVEMNKIINQFEQSYRWKNKNSINLILKQNNDFLQVCEKTKQRLREAKKEFTIDNNSFNYQKYVILGSNQQKKNLQSNFYLNKLIQEQYDQI